MKRSIWMDTWNELIKPSNYVLFFFICWLKLHYLMNGCQILFEISQNGWNITWTISICGFLLNKHLSVIIYQIYQERAERIYDGTLNFLFIYLLLLHMNLNCVYKEFARFLSSIAALSLNFQFQNIFGFALISFHCFSTFVSRLSYFFWPFHSFTI